jgi:hypothetical protein
LAIFAGEESRVLEHLAPAHRVLRPATPAVLAREAARLRALGVEVWVSSGAPVADPTHLERIAEFRTIEVLHGHAAHLVLSRFMAEPRTEVAAR